MTKVRKKLIHLWIQITLLKTTTMACIIDMSYSDFENQQPTLQDFKRFNKGGPDLENQLEAIEEYQKARESFPRPRTPLSLFSRVNVLSFLPIFGVL